jgi:Flp pilus assembly protein CpaB
VQENLSRLLRNRSGAVIAGAIAALVAVILLIVYLHSYRASVNSGQQAERVMIATKLIPNGTSGSVIAKEGLYQLTTVQKDQLKLYAINDPSVIQDRVAVADIFPGQQLTQDDFTTESSLSIPYNLTGAQRAIAIPVDATHGLIGQVSAGNFVDIYAGVSGGNGNATLVTLLAPDVYVLVAPGNGSADAVIRINTNDAAKFAYAADNVRLWLVLRPQTGASPTLPTTATLATLLSKVGAAGTGK